MRSILGQLTSLLIRKESNVIQTRKTEIAKRCFGQISGRYHASKTVALVMASTLFLAGTACGEEIRVVTSGAFAEVCRQLVPEFDRATHNITHIEYGSSKGGAPDSIPNRLQRNEPFDVVIMSGPALDELIKEGKVVAGSRVDLVRSSIGMAVRAGAPKPDISSVEAFKRALLHAKSIAYSASVSGTYLSTELFTRLGIADQMKGKSQRIESERVGAVVARGDTEIGFQQVSELLPIAGIDYVGPLPSAVQKMSVFSAGVVVGAKEPDAARKLIQFLASPAAAPTIKKRGLEPMVSQ